MSAELLTSRPTESESTLILTLSNPGARNALHPDMYAAGIEALDFGGARSVDPRRRDHRRRQLFLRGRQSEPPARKPRERPAVQAESIDLLGEWISALRLSSKPVIAAVDGAAAGAGFSLALACDLIVAADDAKFVMSYARVGLTPDGGGSWFLAQALPRQLATEVLIEGKPIGASASARTGRRQQTDEAGAARDTAVAWADELGKISPNSVARIKGLIGAAGTQPLADHLVAERDSFVASLHHREGLEGISAFLEKRAPVYK